MPSQFETMFAASALPDLYATFGVSGSEYQAPDPASAAVACMPRLDRHEPMEVDRKSNVSGETQSAMVYVQQSEITKPVRKGSFFIPTLSGVEVWKIATTPKLFAGEHYCSCVRSSVEAVMRQRAKE